MHTFNKVDIEAVTFFSGKRYMQTSETEHKELNTYECIFTIVADDKQVVLNMSGDEEHCNCGFVFEAEDFTAAYDALDFDAADLFAYLESQGWENNYLYLSENCFTKV